MLAWLPPLVLHDPSPLAFNCRSMRTASVSTVLLILVSAPSTIPYVILANDFSVMPNSTSSNASSVVLGTDKFSVCLKAFREHDYGDNGGTNNRGEPVNYQNATALTYTKCVEACGSDQVPFNWATFFQRVSQWLLPWLALISQLPFGADDKLDNLESVLLTIGSPTLAAYSLALTVLNARWIARRFAHYHWPSTRDAVRVLTSLQQSPLDIDTSECLLDSLIVLPENDMWWKDLFSWINSNQTWSMSAIFSIAWVIIAYVYTVIDSFTGDIRVSIPNNGQGVGSIWIWLLPVVIGWLQVSPTCNRSRVRSGLLQANKAVRIATLQGEPVVPNRKAISLRVVDKCDLNVHTDEQCTAPIYNYARFFKWNHIVEQVSEVYCAVSEKAQRHESVDPETPWITSSSVHPNNRTGTYCQVKSYATPTRCNYREKQSHWGTDAILRMIIASILALLLSWGTTGAALVVGWFTYTYGIGCRAGSYIIYGVLSTVAWMLLVASSMFAHIARGESSVDEQELEKSASGSTRTLTGLNSSPFPRRRYSKLAITTRRIGKGLAAFNAIWVVASCLFQFSNFYNQCFCNSSIFNLWGDAYVVISFDTSDAAAYKQAWIGGVGLAGGTAFIFSAFISLFINPTLPE